MKQNTIRVGLWTCTALGLAGCQSSQSTEQAAAPGALPRGTNADAPKLDATTYFAHAHLLERQGEFERAAMQYRDALKLVPTFVVARNRLGITLNKLGRHSEATVEFQQVLEKNPKLAYVWNNLGFSLYLEGRFEESEQALLHALELKPEFARASMNYGVVLGKLARWDEAMEQFAKAGSQADAHYNIGLLQTEAGLYAEAAQSLEQALALNPKLDAARKQLHEVARLAAAQAQAEAEQLAQMEGEPQAETDGEPEATDGEPEMTEGEPALTEGEPALTEGEPATTQDESETETQTAETPAVAEGDWPDDTQPPQTDGGDWPDASDSSRQFDEPVPVGADPADRPQPESTWYPGDVIDVTNWKQAPPVGPPTSPLSGDATSGIAPASFEAGFSLETVLAGWSETSEDVHATPRTATRSPGQAEPQWRGTLRELIERSGATSSGDDPLCELEAYLERATTPATEPYES